MTNPQHYYLTLADAKSRIKNTALETLDIEIVSIDDEQVVLRMPITPKVHQPLGQLHGGVSLVLAETAASLHAAWGINLLEKAPVGIEINGSHLRSAAEGTAEAIAKPVRRSRTLVVHQVEIYHVETGKLLTIARVTNYYKSVGAARDGNN
ncbi:MAG: PaaI family thioesterase [Anaerolineae bacterium]|nr:PaaI family thioesterase [Anaerolineae bacterium]